MNPLKVAVIGVGYLGQHHARIAHESSRAHLIAVVDPDEKRGSLVAEQFHTRWVAEWSEIADQVDAIQVAAPTVHHHQLGMEAIKLGKHILMEKPLASRHEEAQLLHAAHEQSLGISPAVIRAVGHLERFNPVVQALRERKFTPRFLETVRVSPFPMRSTEVDVVMDVMIHDLDLIRALVGRPIRDVEAFGIPVLTQQADLVNARIKFEGGTVAILTASRVAQKKERTLRVFGNQSYAKLNFADQTMELLNLVKGTSGFEIKNESISIQEGEPLKIEIEEFYRACLGLGGEYVSWSEGFEAMKVADLVQKAVQKSLSEIQGT